MGVDTLRRGNEFFKEHSAKTALRVAPFAVRCRGPTNLLFHARQLLCAFRAREGL